jgi:photosystem II stability/assembly factor-like uncharacterized protein
VTSWPRLLLVLAITLLTAAFAAAHDTRVRPSAPARRIDPTVGYPAGVVSGGGGHFHSLLLARGSGTPLFAGTHLGLFRSDDDGRTWRLAAARFSGEDVHALAASHGALYAATHGQGLLVSPDSGVHWRNDSRGLPGRDLHALAVDPRHPDVVYVWVVGHGLFRRAAPGQPWELCTSAGALTDIESLTVHPEDGTRLYAGTLRGVWVSDDGGRRWRFPPGGLASRTAGVARRRALISCLPRRSMASSSATRPARIGAL